MSDDATPVRSEAELIETYLAPLAAGFAGAFGLKDDCAVAAPRAGHEFVFKTDAVAAGVHFLPDDAAGDIAWKALAVNLSDLAAKGAEPIGYLLSLSFPTAPTHGWMRRFAAGLADAQSAFAIQLMGGDTDRRPGPLTITPMVVGEIPRDTIPLRSAARAGQAILVSGSLGDAALGLALGRDPALAARLGLADAEAASLRARYLRPVPRLALRDVVRGSAVAAMDLSDGLIKDLGRMCRASGVGADLIEAQLPRSPAFLKVARHDPALAARALFAGDDYEVLLTLPAEAAARAIAAAAAAGVAMAVIGTITAAKGIRLLDGAGRELPLPASGYDHF